MTRLNPRSEACDGIARFDADPAAAPLFKERVLWILLLGLFFFLVYGSTNQIATMTAPIDLAPELASPPPADRRCRHRSTRSPGAIDAQRAAGGVYGHCALGLSRSARAVCAWMIRQGRTKEEALARLDSVRPQRVRRPYMTIALDLYERHQGRSPLPEPMPPGA